MRRASELYPGEAKTDRRDSFILADTARTHARRLHWLQVSDETLEQLRVLGGYDDDLAHDVTRTTNRLRDSCCRSAPHWSGFSAHGLTILPPGHYSRATQHGQRFEQLASGG